MVAPLVCGAPRSTRGPDGYGPGPFLPSSLRWGRGWLNLRLDGEVDWDEVEAVCEDAYRTVAQKRLVRHLADTDCL